MAQTRGHDDASLSFRGLTAVIQYSVIAKPKAEAIQNWIASRDARDDGVMDHVLPRRLVAAGLACVHFSVTSTQAKVCGYEDFSSKIVKT